MSDVDIQKLLLIGSKTKEDETDHLSLEEVFLRLVKTHSLKSGTRLFGWWVALASDLKEVKNLTENKRSYRVMYTDLQKLRQAKVVPEDLMPRHLPIWIRVFIASGFKAGLLAGRMTLDSETRNRVDLLLNEGKITEEDARQLDKVFRGE
jgi:hypothetical protein